MTYQATVVRVLIASPGDTVNERQVLREVIGDWNGLNGELGVHLQPLMWELDGTPELGDRPQGIINRQLVDKADMAIGVFWTHLGTPTGVAESGTVEEIERMTAAEKPVLLYFSRKPVVLESVDPGQYALLSEAKARFMTEGLVDQFDSEDQLYRRVPAALTRTIREKFAPPESAASLESGALLGGGGFEPPEPSPRAVGAQLVARVDRFGQRERFVVENRGGATAENVAIAVEAADDGSKPTIFLPGAPISSIPPGGAVDFATAIGFGSSLIWDVMFRWTDSQGEQETRQTVTF